MLNGRKPKWWSKKKPCINNLVKQERARCPYIRWAEWCIEGQCCEDPRWSDIVKYPNKKRF